MTLPKFNLRIGGKLIAMSAIGILLVTAMIAVQVFGNAAIESAGDRAVRQSMLARSVVEAKAAIRGMQIGVRDIRLALSAEDLDRAVKYVEARRDRAANFVANSLKLAQTRGNIDLLNSMATLID